MDFPVEWVQGLRDAPANYHSRLSRHGKCLREFFQSAKPYKPV